MAISERTVSLTVVEINYIIRRLREVDPGYAGNPEFVASRLEKQLGHNVHDNYRQQRAYLESLSVQFKG